MQSSTFYGGRHRSGQRSVDGVEWARVDDVADLLRYWSCWRCETIRIFNHRRWLCIELKKIFFSFILVDFSISAYVSQVQHWTRNEDGIIGNCDSWERGSCIPNKRRIRTLEDVVKNFPDSYGAHIHPYISQKICSKTPMHLYL